MIRRTRTRVMLLAAALLTVTLPTGQITSAGPVSGELFCTTFPAPNPFISDGTVNRVTLDFDDASALTLSVPQERPMNSFGTEPDSTKVDTAGPAGELSSVPLIAFVQDFWDDITPLSGPGSLDVSPPRPRAAAMPLPAAFWPAVTLLGGLWATTAKRRRTT